MKKKLGIILILLLCISLFTTTVSAIPIPDTKQNTDLRIHTASSRSTITFFDAQGPINPSYAEITINDGPALQTKILNLLINTRLYHFIAPKHGLIPVRDLDMTITFKKDVKIQFSPFSYLTALYEIQDREIINHTRVTNTPHTVNVTGFTGIFKIQRPALKRLSPAIFWFMGVCDEATFDMPRI